MNSSSFNSHYHSHQHQPQHFHYQQQQQQHNHSLGATSSISSPTLSSLEMITPTTPTTSTRNSSDILGHFSSVNDLHNLDDSFSVVRTPLSINACSSSNDDVNIHNDLDDDEDDDDDDDEDDEDAIWRISTEQAAYYRSQFTSLQPDLQGLVRGTVAKVFFEKSGLPVSNLSAIWKLSDADRDGALSLPEFSIAMHLVVLKRNGVPLPARLPTVMLQVYGSLGVPVYHLPSPLAGVPSVSERESGNSGRFYRHFSGDSDEQQGPSLNQKHFLRQSSLQESTGSQSAGSTPYFGVENSSSNNDYRKNQWTVFTESPPPPTPPQAAKSSSFFTPLKSSTSTESIITANQSPSTYLSQHRQKYPQQYLQYQQEKQKQMLQQEQQQPPLPVNFDYNAESIASDPNILHPVPLRFSPLQMPDNSAAIDSSSTIMTSAFTRLSLAVDKKGSGSGGNGLLSPGSDNSKQLELSHLPLSAIPAIPGEWHVAKEETKMKKEKNKLNGQNLLIGESDGVLGRQFYDLMISSDYDDDDDDNDDDDDDDNDDGDNNCGESSLAAAYLGLGEGPGILAAEQASPDFDESSKPYLIPRDGTLHSVLAIQGLEERLIARYMNSSAEPIDDTELNQSSTEELRKQVTKLQEQNAVSSKQNEMLLVEMLTLLKLVRKGVNKI